MMARAYTIYKIELGNDWTRRVHTARSPGNAEARMQSLEEKNKNLIRPIPGDPERRARLQKNRRA
jgi:hypothetical protein